MTGGLSIISKVRYPSNNCIDLSHRGDGPLGDTIKWLIIITKYCIDNNVKCTLLTKGGVFGFAPVLIMGKVVDEVISVDHGIRGNDSGKDHNEYVQDIFRDIRGNDANIIEKHNIATFPFIACREYINDGILEINSDIERYANYIWDNYGFHGHKVVTIHVRRWTYAKCREFTTRFFVDIYNELSKYGVKCLFLLDYMEGTLRRQVGSLMSYPNIPIIHGITNLQSIYGVIDRSDYFVGCDTGTGWLGILSRAKPIIMMVGQMLYVSMEYKAFDNAVFITYNDAYEKSGNKFTVSGEGIIYSLNHKLITDVILNEV